MTVALSVGIWLSVVHAPAGWHLSVEGQLGRPWGGRREPLVGSEYTRQTWLDFTHNPQGTAEVCGKSHSSFLCRLPDRASPCRGSLGSAA